MSKSLYIAEKPSVAREFARVLHVDGRAGDGYLESEDAVVTWCVGHLVTMSYPEAYDPKLKKWSLEDLPFIPETFKYELIDGVKKQFNIVKRLLNREDVTCIYVCTDSGREGEYIYRLVDQMAEVGPKEKRRVWIDSQTEEEILRGIREARPLSDYDHLADSAYLRAKEDYLMGINFSRLLTLKYGQQVANYLRTRYSVVSVGRVMTCVLGMVVRREREIRNFVKTPFYRVIASVDVKGRNAEAEWRVVEGSVAYGKPVLYKDNGFKTREDAQKLIDYLNREQPLTAEILKIERKTEKKNPPLLYNLAELQNDCSRMFKLSPDETLKYVQELYEKKLVTYPRTDARVLSTAVAKEISRNIKGLTGLDLFGEAASEVLAGSAWKGIGKTRYTNDKQITDHYAIIPTGQTGAVRGLSPVAMKVYLTIVRRFLSIFYPPAQYQKASMTLKIRTENFFASFKVLTDEGYLKVAGIDVIGRRQGKETENEGEGAEDKTEDVRCDADFLEVLKGLRKGTKLPVTDLGIKEGETSPPKRYNSGSMILAMENAGQLIEDEELRAQIKGSGIGTSATRAEILKKLVTIRYLNLNKKTQIITPTQLGEMIYDVVDSSIRSLLNPELTASWEKGLTYVAEGTITSDVYMEKLKKFITDRTMLVMQLGNQYQLRTRFDAAAPFYKQAASASGGKAAGSSRRRKTAAKEKPAQAEEKQPADKEEI